MPGARAGGAGAWAGAGAAGDCDLEGATRPEVLSTSLMTTLLLPLARRALLPSAATLAAAAATTALERAVERERVCGIWRVAHLTALPRGACASHGVADDPLTPPHPLGRHGAEHTGAQPPPAQAGRASSPSLVRQMRWRVALFACSNPGFVLGNCHE